VCSSDPSGTPIGLTVKDYRLTSDCLLVLYYSQYVIENRLARRMIVCCCFGYIEEEGKKSERAPSVVSKLSNQY